MSRNVENIVQAISRNRVASHGYKTKQTGIKQIAIGGGVSANSALQKAVHDEAARSGWEVFIPRLGFSLDNAGMVAVTGYYKYLAGQFIGLDAAPFARTTLE